MKRRRQNLREYVDHLPPGPLEVDEAAGIVRGVKVLGLDSKNGRRYLREAVSRAAKRYEGIKVNIDHPVSPGEARAFACRFGRLREVRVVEDGCLRANIHYNPDHAHAKTFVWWARNDPEAIGLSHNADGEVEEAEDGTLTVVEIIEVHSVDVVADPATTNGLRESHMDPLDVLDTGAGDGDGNDPKPGDEHYADHIGKAVVAILNDEAIPAEEKKKKILHLLKLDEVGAEKPGGDGGNPDDITDEDEDEETMESLKAKVEAYKIRDKVAERREKARCACQKVGLPAEAITEAFLGVLLDAKDGEHVKALIEDRKVVLGSTAARSIGPGGGGTNLQESNKARPAAEVAASLRG